MVVILTAILRRIARVAKAANDKLADIAKGCAVTDIEVPVFAFASSTPDSVGLSFINAVPILLNDPQVLPHVMVRIFWKPSLLELILTSDGFLPGRYKNVFAHVTN